MRARSRRPRRLALSLFALLTAACSARGCATCVGYTPNVDVSAIEGVDLVLESSPMQVALGLPRGPDALCVSLAPDAKLSWNGITATTTRAAGGTNVWCSRAEAYTRCDPHEASLPADLLARARAPATDRFEVSDASGKLVVDVALGRPRIALAPDGKEAAIVFEGLDGSLDDVSPRATTDPPGGEVVALKVLERSKDRARVALDPKQRGALRMVGTARLSPKATCTPAKTSCTARVVMEMSIPFTVAAGP